MTLQLNKIRFSGSLFVALLCCSTGLLADQTNPTNQAGGWEDGWQIFDEGNELFVKGNKNLAEGRKLIRQGEDQIAPAGKSLRDNRNQYVALIETGDASTDVAQSLATLHANIDREIATITEGNDLVARGHALVSKGQQQIKQSRETMQKGYGKAKKSKKAVNFRLMLPESDGRLN